MSDVFECFRSVGQWPGVQPIERAEASIEYGLRRLAKIRLGADVGPKEAELVQSHATASNPPLAGMKIQMDNRAA